MKEQAMAKIRAEMKTHKNAGSVQAAGMLLLDYMETHASAAEQIMAEGKTVKGSLDAMRDKARKNAVGGVGVLTDGEGLTVMLEYFGIRDTVEDTPAVPVPAVNVVNGFDVDLDALLMR